MRKFLFLPLALLMTSSLFASPITCPYQPTDCSNLGDVAFWQSCFFSASPNTTALTEIRTSMIDQGKDQAMQIVCMYDGAGKEPAIGRVFNATAIIHLTNKDEWKPLVNSTIPHVFACKPHTSNDCSFSVIN